MYTFIHIHLHIINIIIIIIIILCVVGHVSLSHLHEVLNCDGLCGNVSLDLKTQLSRLEVNSGQPRAHSKIYQMPPCDITLQQGDVGELGTLVDGSPLLQCAWKG